jgi:hypothetical protein
MLQPFTPTRSPRLKALGGALLAGALAGACTDSGEGGIIFVSRNTTASVAGDSIARVQERWILFQADEFTTGASGTQLNGDGDTTDLVAFVVDMASQRETNLEIAADDLVILGSGATAKLLLVVTEGSDEVDWNDDGDSDDVVLLTIPAGSAGSAAPTVLATLASNDEPLVVVGERVYFVEDESAGPALADGETSIAYVELDANQSVDGPFRVEHLIVDPLSGSQLVDVLADPDLIGEDGGLLFFTMDETSEVEAGGSTPGVNLNGGLTGLDDTDTTDEHVLGVLDTTDPDGVAQSLALAVASDAKTVRTVATGPTSDPSTLIAFLVSEADQGPTNLNEAGAPGLPGGWEPLQCTSPDADTEDQVLFALQWDGEIVAPSQDWQNTGLVGSERVLALESNGKAFVATLSSEADAACDLNDDGDTEDTVFRFAPVGGGTAFVTSVEALLAVEAVNGGVSGVSDLDGRFVAVISEADNDQSFDGIPGNDHDLLAWLNPEATTNSTPQPWVFDHSPNTGTQAAGTDWMAERPQRDRLNMTYQEEVHGAPINTGGDSDETDSIPTFSRFDPIDDFDFPGPPVAGRANNTGIALSDNDVAFYRVDENADARDWNGDGDKQDLVLFRTTVSTLQNSNFLGVLNNLQRPAAELGGTVGAAYLADEAMAEVDYNEDGDQADLVLRWFRIG